MTTIKGAAILFSIGLFLAPHVTRSRTQDSSSNITSKATSPIRDEEVESVAEVVSLLRRNRVDDMDTRIPTDALPLLSRLKHGLRDLIENVLDSEPSGSPKAWEQSLLAMLSRKGLTVEEPPKEVMYDPSADHTYAYGDIYALKLERSEAMPNLLVATATIGVCCGEDTSLYLFYKRGERWRLDLAQESDHYEEVNGAQMDLQYVVLPDEYGGYTLVVAHVDPWCTSNMRSTYYRVLRPSDSPYQPQVLVDTKAIMWLDNDPPYLLTPEPGGFSLKFEVSDEYEPGSRRESTRHYKVGRDFVSRTGPLALQPEYFIAEWLDLDWADAMKWTIPKERAEIQHWHAALGGRDTYAMKLVLNEPCGSQDARMIEIGFTDYRSEKGADPPPPLFFRPHRDRNRYLVDRISPDRPSDCSD